MNADLVLEQLRVIRNDIVTLKQQNHDDYQFLATRMTAMEQHLAALVTALPAYGDPCRPARKAPHARRAAFGNR